MSLLQRLASTHIVELPPPMPVGRKILLTDLADEEDLYLGGENEQVIGRAYSMVYKDSKGNVSERLITVRSIRQIEAEDNAYLVNCYCHHRKAIRSFRSERIVELVNTDTGQIYDTDEAIEEWAGRHGHSFWKDVKEFNEIIVCAVFAARIDNRFSADERFALLKWMQRRMQVSFDLAHAESYIFNLRPTHDQFSIAFRALVGQEKEGDCMLLIDDIINADEIVTAEEAHLINSL